MISTVTFGLGIVQLFTSRMGKTPVLSIVMSGIVLATAALAIIGLMAWRSCIPATLGVHGHDAAPQLEEINRLLGAERGPLRYVPVSAGILPDFTAAASLSKSASAISA